MTSTESLVAKVNSESIICFLVQFETVSGHCVGKSKNPFSFKSAEMDSGQILRPISQKLTSTSLNKFLTDEDS